MGGGGGGGGGTILAQIYLHVHVYTRDTLWCGGGGGGGGGEQYLHKNQIYLHVHVYNVYMKEGNRRPSKCTDSKQKVNYRKHLLSCLGQDSNKGTPKF